jgi:hypothetical protein
MASWNLNNYRSESQSRTLGAPIGSYLEALERRSIAIPRLLARNMDRLALAWMALFLLLAVPAVALSVTPARSASELSSLILPYLLVAIGPVAGLQIALRAFPNGLKTARPLIHLSPYGRWKRVSVIEARDSADFGPAGFMASMLVGLLLNVVVRSIEFLVAVPALSSSAPEWGQKLFHVMAADVAVMGFFYMVCFVMALRSVPYFPKMLLFAWILDVFVQLAIARAIGPLDGLPSGVAVSLRNLLEGNITKVMISAFVWLPYLVLSDRVNITYRRRARALPT